MEYEKIICALETTNNDLSFGTNPSSVAFLVQKLLAEIGGKEAINAYLVERNGI